MAGWSNIWELNVLDWFFNASGDGAPSPPANLYLGLFETQPADDDSGAALWAKEVDTGQWNTYGRITIPSSGSNWETPTPGDPSSYQNANLLQFNEMTAGSGVTVSYWALLDAATLGTGALVFHGILQSSLAVANNVQPQFNAGALLVRLGG